MIELGEGKVNFGWSVSEDRGEETWKFDGEPRLEDLYHLLKTVMKEIDSRIQSSELFEKLIELEADGVLKDYDIPL